MTQSTTGGALYWEAGIDPQKLYDEVAKINGRLRDLANNTAKEGQKMDDVFKNLGLAIGGYLSLDALAGFGQKVIQVRGEFQQLGIAFETMLGSKVKSDAMMADMVKFAALTPFTLTDVASNAKQLMAMGVESGNVISTLKSLGDVAAGVSVPLERVAINYGQVLTMGKLQGRELRDFAMAGIPLLGELAKNLGKSKAEITDMVSAGSIGFKEVEKAFQTMSGEGGKFANLMEKQNASVTGQISNLQDKMAVMFNSIGKANEGIIYSGIAGAADFITHYQDIINVIKVLAVTYGTYKAVLMATVAVQKIAEASELASRLIAVAKAGRLATLSTLAFNGSLLANPIVAAIAALAAITTAIIVYSKSARTSEEVTNSLNQSISGLKDGAKDIDGLVETYNKLSEKTSRTDQENVKLTDTMNGISKAVSGSATAFDKYGNALGINMDKVKAYSNSIKNAFKIAIEADVKAKQKELDDLQQQVDSKRSVYETGQVTETVFTGGSSQYGMSTSKEVTRKATQAEIDNSARMVRELQGKINNVNQEIENGKKALDGIVEKQATSTAAHAETVAEAVVRIDEAIAKVKSDRDKLAATDKTTFNKYTDQIDKLENEKKVFEGKAEADQKRADKEQDAKNQAKEELEKRHLTNLEEFANWESGIGSKKIANMEDSLAKELAQNKLAYETREKEINREKLQTLALLNKEAGIKPGAKNEIKELKGDQKKDYDQKIAYAQTDQANADIKARKDWALKVQAIWDEVNSSTLTGYEKEIQANKQKYDQMAKDALKANDPNLSKAVEEERLKAIQQINNNHALDKIDLQEQVENRRNEILANGFDREAKLEALNFQTWLTHQKERLRILKLSTDEKDQAQAKILEAEINAGTNEKGLKDEARIRNMIVSSAEKLVSVVGQYNSKLGNTLGALLTIGKTFDTVLNKSKNWKKEDAVASIVDGATSMIGMIVTSASERKRVMNEYYDSIIQQQRKYNLLLNDQLLLNNEINGTLFIKDYQEKLTDSTKAYNDAQKNIAEGMKSLEKQKAIIGQKNAVDGNSVLTGAGAGAAIGAGIGSIVPVIGTAIGALVGGIAGAITGIFAGKKKVDVLGDLLTTYPKLIKVAQDGTKSLDTELAKTLIDSKAITEETKGVLNNIIEWQAQAEKAREQLKQVISDLSGSLGDDLRNALVTAFKDGTSSAVAFGDSVNKVLENIMTNMLFNKVFEGAFKQLEEGMAKSYDVGGDQTWLDDFKTFLSQKQTLTDQFNSEMQSAKDAALASGFDIFKKTDTETATSRQATSKGFAAMSQETGNDLNGRFTAIQGHTFAINETLKVMMVNSTSVVKHLQSIDASSKRLESIEINMESTKVGIDGIKAGIDTINLKGIILKQ